MGISEQIDGIIMRRKNRLPMMEEMQKELGNMRRALAELEYMRSQMIDGEGKVCEGGKYAGLLAQNPEMAWKLQALDLSSCYIAVDRAVKALEDGWKRFSREYISISAIGEARRGKSELLKSISGLNDYVIPAFESTDCTGTPSIIYNKEGSGLCASLTFKSRQQMLQMAQVYLNKIISDPSRQIHLGRMEDIKKLDMEDILERANKGDPDGIYRKYLSKMIAHYTSGRTMQEVKKPYPYMTRSRLPPLLRRTMGYR